ncbi:MAG TPA: response regulator [Candidatus Limnocylindria bacterium]|nr:response regulator [Candidatus Limnocylindria bacterium]
MTTATREGYGGAIDPPPVVVVVEDDIGTLGLLADLAEDAGWEARSCRSLRQFERTLGDVDPSLIILDDELPDGRGGEQAVRLRSNPQVSDVPVVLCTAAPQSRLTELGGKLGGTVAVVTKPFTIEDIERVLDAALRRRRRRVASTAAG